ncbi:MAG: hypothetical protein RL492_1161 [Verrucomicrobiota bacterium]|jgi:lysophospholipase L1-like esterase
MSANLDCMKSVLVLCAALLLAPLATLRAEPVLKSGDKVAFLGDSITAQGWTNPHGYVRLVVAGLQANGVAITPLPAGIGGHKSNDMLARLERDVLSKKPNWVTISCGMNDVIHGAKGIPLDQYQANMTEIVTRCQKAGIKVALCTTTTAGAWDSAQTKSLGEYSAFLRGLAKERQCLLIDLYPAFVETLKKADPLHGLTGDGVHMTPEGNLLMASTALTALGCSEAQVAKAREAWLDLPGAGAFSTRVDIELNKKYFTAQCSLTLRQRERLLAAAAAAKRPTLNHWAKELLLTLMKRQVKPQGPYESLDALFAPETKAKVQADLQAQFSAEIAQLTAK